MNETDVTFDAARAAEFALTVSVGEAASPDGLTRVHVDGKGKFVAEQLHDEAAGDKAAPPPEPGSQAGEMPAPDAVQLLRSAAQFPWGREFPSRPGIPDEAVVVFEFSREGKTLATLKLWLREAEADPLAAPVLKALRTTLSRVTGDRLYL